jgi:hypothetical protein
VDKELEEKMANQFLDGHGPEGAAADVECAAGA